MTEQTATETILKVIELANRASQPDASEEDFARLNAMVVQALNSRMEEHGDVRAMTWLAHRLMVIALAEQTPPATRHSAMFHCSVALDRLAEQMQVRQALPDLDAASATTLGGKRLLN